MENIQTSLTLPPQLDLSLRHLARQKGQTKNSLIQQAVSDYVERQAILGMEKKLQAQARLMGIESEEDVVELIREVRNAQKKSKK